MIRLRSILLIILLAFTASVSITQAEESPNPLPLLPPGLHIGVIYSPPEDDPAVHTKLDSAFGEALQSGLNGYELAISWADLEPTPGQIDTTNLENQLTILSSLNLRPYLSITTINTSKLTLPSDLMTADEYGLADNRHFDDPVMLDRFAKVLDAVVPLLVKHNGFFISVGNEVEGWLDARPDEIPGFVAFTAAARAHTHEIEPGIGVSATITYGGVQRQSKVINDLLAVSDAAAYTYYPLNDDFSVRDPAAVADDLALMVKAAGDLPVLFQEIGYPSGYISNPGNGSSGEKQRQFIENFFAAVQQYPQVRFVSVLQLSDWSTTICDAFVQYYTDQTTVPQLHEMLCSLGMMEYDGTPKPAYDAFLATLRSTASG